MEWVVIWIICGIAGYVIGKNKGRAGAGFWLGFLLGPIGLIISIFMKADEQKVEENSIGSGEMKKCPSCAELIKKDAKVCRYCGHIFEDEGIMAHQQTEKTQKNEKKFGGLNDQLFS